MNQLHFTMKLMVFACIILAIILVIDTISWFMWREVSGMLAGGQWFFMTIVGMYMAKSGYEHYIDNKYKGEENGDTEQHKSPSI